MRPHVGVFATPGVRSSPDDRGAPAQVVKLVADNEMVIAASVGLQDRYVLSFGTSGRQDQSD